MVGVYFLTVPIPFTQCLLFLMVGYCVGYCAVVPAFSLDIKNTLNILRDILLYSEAPSMYFRVFEFPSMSFTVFQSCDVYMYTETLVQLKFTKSIKL